MYPISSYQTVSIPVSKAADLKGKTAIVTGGRSLDDSSVEGNFAELCWSVAEA